MAIEPLYTLRVAAELIPFPTAQALYMWLWRHKAEFPPPVYRRGRGIEHRLLTESEILKIREMTLLTGMDSYHGRQSATRRGRRSSGLIETMIRRCANA